MSTCKKVILLVLHYVFINGTKMKFWAVVLGAWKLAEWCSALVIMTPCCTSSDILISSDGRRVIDDQSAFVHVIQIQWKARESKFLQSRHRNCHTPHLLWVISEWECGDIQVCACSKELLNDLLGPCKLSVSVGEIRLGRVWWCDDIALIVVTLSRSHIVGIIVISCDIPRTY